MDGYIVLLRFRRGFVVIFGDEYLVKSERIQLRKNEIQWVANTALWVKKWRGPEVLYKFQ